jgi:hypothetical protein
LQNLIQARQAKAAQLQQQQNIMKQAGNPNTIVNMSQHNMVIENKAITQSNNFTLGNPQQFSSQAQNPNPMLQSITSKVTNKDQLVDQQKQGVKMFQSVTPIPKINRSNYNNPNEQ